MAKKNGKSEPTFHTGVPGQVWHITHRCHKQEFLLKFAKDGQRWLTQRYALMDSERLISLLGIESTENFSETYKEWVEERLGRHDHVRETKWSESIAVGTESFVEKIKEKLGGRAIGRGAVEAADA